MTNNQAVGYGIMALKKLNANKEFIKEFEAQMKYLFDMKTEEEAEKEYNNF